MRGKTLLRLFPQILAVAVLLDRVHASNPRAQVPPWQPSQLLLLEGTVITMNGARDVLPQGRVLVRGGRIAAVWDGPLPPDGVDLQGVVRADLGPDALTYPGLINLHDHPLNDALPLWQTPSSHLQSSAGRPTGTEPYANRYQWSAHPPPEFRRLVVSPRTALTEAIALNLAVEVVKFGEARATRGLARNASDMRRRAEPDWRSEIMRIAAAEAYHPV